jgi:Zn-dependent M16 (insulinase) family peptidase
MTFAATQPTALAGEFDTLEPNQKFAALSVEAMYENENGNALGARFRHDATGHVLDILRIQSVPQGFMWVNSLAPSDQGEPHTLEHLLLGKGNKGRFVSSLEDMSLGSSSAYTERRRTCYHFNVDGDKEVFFKIFEAKLDAMINPNFSDEEIRREVCNMGVKVNSETGEMQIEEKGTVYNEMVSSFERNWGHIYRATQQMMYGAEHPLSMSSGGLPAAIREMTPDDLRAFHSATHHLNNMGSAISIGDEIPLTEALTRLSDILNRVEPEGILAYDPAALWDRIPSATPAPYGTVTLTHFPHQNENEPGLLWLAWPGLQDFGSEDLYLYELFLGLMASGQTSNLYKKFIDSETREMDLGANAISYWLDEQPGYPIFIDINNVNPALCTEEGVNQVRDHVMAEIQRIADFAEGSDELAAFNKRALNQVTQDRRATRKFLNSPPRWGYRGTGSSWMDHLQRLNRNGGFRRDLSQKSDLANAEALLTGGTNFWKEKIAQWQLLEVPPYGAAATANPSMITESETAREGRTAAFVEGLKKEHSVSTDAEAIAKYNEYYEGNTSALAEIASQITLPSFTETPPLALDGNLQYNVATMPGGGQLVASTFDNMTSSTIGVSFNLNVIPQNRVLYIATLPTVIRSIGVVKDGEAISFDEFSEALRKEILSLRVNYDVNFRTQRAELSLRCAGSEFAETERGLGWLTAALFNPYLAEENLPRIRDAVDQALKSSRDRMRGSEESWVNTPAWSYWRQSDRALLNAECFLTQTHALSRISWKLKDAAGQAQGFNDFVTKIKSSLQSLNAEEFATLLGTISEGAKNDIVEFNGMDENLAALVKDATDNLRLSLSEVPESSRTADLTYLCDQMALDLATTPAQTLSEIGETLDILRHQDNVRAFMVSNTTDRDKLAPGIYGLVRNLNAESSTRNELEQVELVKARIESRGAFAGDPVFVALVNENTRAGVHLHSSECANFETEDEEELLRFLAARLYAGGGAHGLFMKTWGAGLAYSNGVRTSEYRGRMNYYAERCPDLAQTMKFVTDELKNAPYDTTLAEYAVAQIFGGGRSGDNYERRGEAMAADLADGLTPEVVEAFRERILKLRKDPELYDKLHKRMINMYGNAMPGLGPNGAEATANANAIFYVIGPDKQLDSWEEYLGVVEPDAQLTRIYPRDYWVTLADTK